MDFAPFATLLPLTNQCAHCLTTNIEGGFKGIREKMLAFRGEALYIEKFSYPVRVADKVPGGRQALNRTAPVEAESFFGPGVTTS